MKFLIIFFLLISNSHANFGKEMKFTPKQIKKIRTHTFKGGVELNWIKTIKDKENLTYVVKAEIYPEDPNTMFLTLRGGGITLLDISTPNSPKLIQHWDEGDIDMEGQDRIGDLFITIGRNGGIYTFKVLKNKKIKKLAYFRFPKLSSYGPAFGLFIPALHTRIYKGKDKKIYAIVTLTLERKLLAVDITDPKNPKYVSSKYTGIAGLEGIQIHKGHAYVGGFHSSKYKVYDISNPKKMREVQKLKDRRFKQMVPAMTPDFPHTLFVALWGRKGGLASFSLANPKRIILNSAIVDKKFGKANRVKIKDKLVLLPLEQSIGGIGIVDIKNPLDLKFVMSMTHIPGVKLPYTLNFKDDYIYLFGSKTNSMAILKITTNK